MRDFVEPGMPLTVALSALAQVVFGHGLFAELVLCTAMLAVAGRTDLLARDADSVGRNNRRHEADETIGTIHR